MPRLECIVKSAIRLDDGRVFTGKRHFHVIKSIVRKTGIFSVIGEQGFVTNHGRFVGRKEAAHIAYYAGQIWDKKEVLYSEDLY